MIQDLRIVIRQWTVLICSMCQWSCKQASASIGSIEITAIKRIISCPKADLVDGLHVALRSSPMQIIHEGEGNDLDPRAWDGNTTEKIKN